MPRAKLPMKRPRNIVDGEDVQECPICKWPYPDWWLNPIHTNQGESIPMCAQCALEQINEHLNISRNRFHGQQAEYNRQNVLEWRRKHPELNPNNR